MKRAIWFSMLILITLAFSSCPDPSNTEQDSIADPIIASYNVIYEGNGHTGGVVPIDNNDYLVGDLVSIYDAGTMIQTGFNFFNWNTTSEGIGSSMAVGSTLNMAGNDLFLFAQWTEYTMTKLTPSDGAYNDVYGNAVNISSDGNTIVVGAVRDDDNGENSGSIYIYSWNGTSWNETKITASDGYYHDYFGGSVSISADGDTIVSGSEDYLDYTSGTIYIYKLDGSNWIETKKTAYDSNYSDYFGKSVAISLDGNTIVAGAPGDDSPHPEPFLVYRDSGSIYIYKWDSSNWIETKIIASDLDSYDEFGGLVAVSSDGNTIITSSLLDDDNGNNSGSIYVYKWDGSNWSEFKIIASDGFSYQRFGYSIDISSDGDTIVSGAYYDEDQSGSLYIYKWNGSSWNETKITASDGESADFFGSSVAISADGFTIISGAYGDDHHGVSSGSLYIYKWNGSNWDETKATLPDLTSGDLFGYGGKVAVNSDGSTIISSYTGDNIFGINSGSIQILQY